MRESDPATLSPGQARQLFRDGNRAPTSGYATDHVQANLIAVPRDLAFELLLFAQRNPKSCPVLDVSDPGETQTSIFAGDLRSDLPAYRIYEHGHFTAEVSDVAQYWRDDLVSFLIGCSFTFEGPLQEAGIPLRHAELGVTVPMYRTNISCRPAGQLSGPMVVSMRPIAADRVAEAVRVTSRYPAVHGAPVHISDPHALGISDLDRPDFGDPVPIHPGEVPVFWACGVTPQAAVLDSAPEFAIGHAPGHMAVTDVRHVEYHV